MSAASNAPPYHEYDESGKCKWCPAERPPMETARMRREHQKLTPGQKHILTLIRRDADADGWAPVSKVVAQLFTKNDIPGGVMPYELCEFERVGDGGRARLTPAGKGLLDALAWL